MAVNEQIDMCTRQCLFREFSRFTFGEQQLWCENCHKLKASPCRNNTTICHDTLNVEDSRMTLLDNAGGPFHCIECNPIGRGNVMIILNLVS